MLPWILEIMIEDEEWEKPCCIICIAISPGTKKSIKENPKTSPLSFPIAKESTSRNRSEVTSGEITV